MYILKIYTQKNYIMTSHLLRLRVVLATEPLVVGETPVVVGTCCQGTPLVAGGGNTRTIAAPKGDTL